jgi:hypothetical protein
MSAPNREQHKNRSSTTLNGAINNSVTSITVADGSVFPSVGNFRLICESEIMICTARSGNSLTVVRGQDGSSAASHSDGTTISMIYSQQGMSRLLQDSDGLFGYSGRPPMLGIYDDDGSTILDSADFTWVNQGGATVTDRGGTMLMKVPIDAGFNVRALERTTPSTPYTYITAFRVICLGDSDCAPSIVAGFRETSSGKLMIFRFLSQPFFSPGDRVAATRASSPTAHFTSLSVANVNCVGDYLWVKVENNGTNIKFYISPDGVEWLLYFSESKTAYFSAGPDRVLWGGVNNANTGAGGPSQAKATEMQIELAHWSKGE